MAGKDRARFIFFKYVPPKKGEKPLKDEQYSTLNEISEADAKSSGPTAFPEVSSFPECPGEPGYPKEPECPECPKEPECPVEEPEYPEFPMPPECPEFPELPEIPEGPCPENAVMHVIQAGDTFWKLAKKYGTTVEAITAANPDMDPLNLQIGETICIPVGVPGAKG